MSLKTFQKQNGLIADGIMGINTALKIKEVFNLNSIECAHFLGQVDHETASFRYSEENLNYSYTRLRQIFGKYFKTDSIAKLYARQPKKIADKVYANRMGNGSENTGDGWKFRGRGSLQLTGSNNYRLFARYKNDLQIISNPDIVATKYYFDSAMWYFEINDIFSLCSDVSYNTIRRVTRKVNGGYNGLSDRIEKTKYYYKIFRRDEEQNIFIDRSGVSDNHFNSVDSKQQEQERIISSETGEQNKTIKDRLLSFIERFTTKKISSGYTYPERDK